MFKPRRANTCNDLGGQRRRQVNAANLSAACLPGWCDLECHFVSPPLGTLSRSAIAPRTGS